MTKIVICNNTTSLSEQQRIQMARMVKASACTTKCVDMYICRRSEDIDMEQQQVTFHEGAHGEHAVSTPQSCFSFTKTACVVFVSLTKSSWD